MGTHKKGFILQVGTGTAVMFFALVVLLLLTSKGSPELLANLKFEIGFVVFTMLVIGVIVYFLGKRWWRDAGAFSWTLSGVILGLVILMFLSLNFMPHQAKFTRPLLPSGEFKEELTFGEILWMRSNIRLTSYKTISPFLFSLPRFVLMFLFSLAASLGATLGYHQSRVMQGRYRQEMPEPIRLASWNWAAFFFTWIWYLVKRMPKKGVFLFLIWLFVNVPAEVIERYIYVYGTTTLERLNLLEVTTVLEWLQVMGNGWLFIHCGRHAEQDFYRKRGRINK